MKQRILGFFFLCLLGIGTRQAFATVSNEDILPTLPERTVMALSAYVEDAPGSRCKYVTHVYANYTQTGVGFRVTCFTGGYREFAFDVVPKSITCPQCDRTIPRYVVTAVQ